MVPDPKQSANPESPIVMHREKGLRIFTYPKVIFIFPTLVTALICGIGMSMIGNETKDPIKEARKAQATATATANSAPASPAPMAKHERFQTTPNLLGILFLGVFAFNLLIMGIDFPRFTVVGIALLILLISFFLLWLGAYFALDLVKPAQRLFGGIFVVANSGFYYMIAVILTVLFSVVYVTRWLDFWEILPNEILHHHGPLSDLERYPTMNLKFDKEIPDVLEFLFLGAGRLVLHVTEERKAIVLDNVLFINAKEEGLKKMMSRLEVRVTTDKEVAEA